MDTELQKLISEISRQVQQQMAEYQKEMMSHIREIADQLVKQQFEQMTYIGKFVDDMLKAAEVNAKIIAPYLLEANLWIPPSIPTLELLYRLQKAITDDKATPEVVRDIFVEYFEENQWDVLQSIVASWKENPYFAERMPIISDALEAHILGKYTLTIPALLAQVEGIASSIVERPAGDSTAIMKTAVDNITYGEFLWAASKDIVISFITSPAGYGGIKSEYFTPEKFPEWLESKGKEENQLLNRHAISHGVQVNYASKENSLRAFLLLDILFWMKRDKWDEKLKWLIRKNAK